MTQAAIQNSVFVSSRGSQRRAFTIVEMLIVIGVIMLLTGLSVMAAGAFFRASEIRQTEIAMRILEAALDEWEIASDRKLTYGVPLPAAIPPIRFDINQDHIETSGDVATDFHFNDSVFDLMMFLNRASQSKSILANIDPELLVQATDADNVKRLSLRDPWDNHLRVIFPGRDGNGLNEDQDGSVRTIMENVHGIAITRQICFVSAGPDGKWGDLHLDTALSALSSAEKDDVDDASDNIYSYDLLHIRP